MSIKLDLNKFKHVKSDQKTTTLQHEDGHRIEIIHSKLSPKAREQFQALSKVAPQAETSTQAQEAKSHYGKVDVKESAPQPMGKVIQKAEGGEIDQKDDQFGYPIKPVGEVNTTRVRTKGSVSGYNDGGKVVHDSADRLKSYGGMKDGFENSTESKPAAKEEPPGEPLPSNQGAIDAAHAKIVNDAAAHKAAHPEEYAKGGKVAKFCAYCGGGIHPGECNGGTVKMAEGGAPPIVPDVNINNIKAKVDQEAAQAPNVDPDQEELRNIYAKEAVPVRERMSGINPKDQVSMDNIDVKALERAKALQESEKAAKQAANNSQVMQDQEQNQAKAALGLPGAQTPSLAASEAAPVPGVQPQASSTVQQPSQGGMSGDPYATYTTGLSNELKGINQSAEAAGALGKAQAAILDPQIQAQQQAQSAFQAHYNDLEQERTAHMQDIVNGQIDPSQYWTGHTDPQTGEKVGGHSKIMTGIGMILAGFNPTGSPNAAINFLQHQMDQNISAQAQNLHSKQNLLAANLQQFGNLRNAVDMTRIMQSDIVAHQLQQAAATAATPQAKAAALQAAGHLQMEASQRLQQLAMMRSMMGMAQNGSNPAAVEKMLGYMRVMNPEMAKEMSSRFVPGVGLASVAVPDNARQELVAHQKLQDSAQDLLAFTKNHTTINPMSADYKVGAQKAVVLQQMIREGMLGTVFRESEKPLLNKMVDENPAGFMKMVSTNPKVRQLLESNAMQANALKKSYGLPVQNEAVAPTPQYKTVNGVKYMRGPNGQAIPVK